jgi:hypothetical protein
MMYMTYEVERDLNSIIARENARLYALGLTKRHRRSSRLLTIGVIMMLLGGIGSLLLAVTKAHGQTQQPGQQYLPAPTTTFPPSIQPPTAKFNPPITSQQPQQSQPQQPQQPQQSQQQLPQQLPNQQLQQQSQQGQPLYNVAQVMACLHNVLDDSIIKASSMTIQNNLNHTISLGLKQSIIANATANLDSCILPTGR